jgi:hypothetical protein
MLFLNTVCPAVASAYGGAESGGEDVVGEAREERGLPHGRVPDDEDLRAWP